MQDSRVYYLLVGAASIVVIVAGLKSAAPLLVPFLLACFISILCAPFLNWMTDHKVPVWLSVTSIVLLLLGLFTFFGSLLSASTLELRNNIPEYRDDFARMFDTLTAELQRLGIAVDENLLGYLEPSSALAGINTVFSGLRTMLVNFVIIIFVVAFILLEASTFQAKLKRASSNGDMTAYATRFARNINRYFVIKSWISLATGVMIGLLVWAIGLDYPMLWGLLAFFLNFVPSIGSFLASIPAIILALVTGGWWLTLKTVLVFLFANTLVGNIIEPRVMGAYMGLSTLVVFSSLIVWGWILGPIGILLAVPLTMVLHIALDSHPDTRWLAVLLGR